MSINLGGIVEKKADKIKAKDKRSKVASHHSYKESMPGKCIDLTDSF